MENREEKIIETNRAEISGRILTEPCFSHKTYGEAFYEILVGVERKSGYVDKLRVMASERLFGDMKEFIGVSIFVRGQVRTYNETMGERSKLNIIVFAKELEFWEDIYYGCNDISLSGFICKPPIKRTSPLGREICDIMLAVNRMYNKSDYIPCIAWGRNAIYSDNLPVGTSLCIEGRLQSREYRKKNDDGSFTNMTAYEVSILKINE